jgi:type I restriction enzyme R subunit
LQDLEIVVSIGKAIDSSVELNNKKDLIVQFVASLTPETSLDKDWQQFVTQKQKEELNRIIEEENLHRDETEIFVKNAFRNGFIPETGTAITKLLPPLNPFAPNNLYIEKKQKVIEKLKLFLERFLGVINDSIE